MKITSLIISIIISQGYNAHAKSPASLANMAKAVTEFKAIDMAKKKPIVVAVIDTGIDTNHPDLKSTMWKNPGEVGIDSKGRDKASNGVDDDGNGYIDDVYGWNFVNQNTDISDQHGHGTHISGIIMGKSEPAILGQLNLPIEIMTLKYFDSSMDFSKTIDYTVAAIEYAIKNGADIINYSSGGYTFSYKEKRAIQKAKDKGIAFITAAGNEGRNIDISPYYPAAYGLDNIISVAATDINDKQLKISNYGRSVNTKAIGKDVVSAAPGGKQQKMTGTSQATASVTRKMIFMKVLVSSEGS